MPFRRTILLFALIAAAWSAWVWINRAESIHRPPTGQPIVHFEIADIGEIQLRRAEAAANLNPLGGVWHFTSPVRDRLDPTAALALYLGLNGLVLQEVIPKTELRAQDRVLEEFGLGRSAVRVRLLSHENQTLHDFRIGHVTPWQSEGNPTMYLQWKSGPCPEDVLVVGGNLRALLDRPFDALRARQALYLPRPPLAISLQSGRERLDLARESPADPWRILRPLRERADGKAIDAFLHALSTTEASALLPRDASPWPGAESARLSIAMDKSTGPPPAPESPVPCDLTSGRLDAAFLLQSSAGKQSLLSRWSDRAYDLVLPAQALSLLQPDLRAFRARNLGDFHFSTSSRLLLRNPEESGEPVVLQHAGPDGWQVFHRNDWLPADPSRIQLAIEALAGCPLLDFPTDSLLAPASYGLDAPVLQVALADQANRRQNLSFSRKDGKVFARFDDASSVYEVPESVLTFLPTRPAAWRGKQLFSFSASDLRQIVLRKPGSPDLALRYNPEENTWLATANGIDRSADLDTASAANLASAIERLSAARWLGETSSAAYSALATPSASLQLSIDRSHDDGSPAQPLRLRLEFAEVSPGAPFLYGKFAAEPDVFLLKKSTLDALGEALFPSESP